MQLQPAPYWLVCLSLCAFCFTGINDFCPNIGHFKACARLNYFSLEDFLSLKKVNKIFALCYIKFICFYKKQSGGYAWMYLFFFTVGLYYLDNCFIIKHNHSVVGFASAARVTAHIFSTCRAAVGFLHKLHKIWFTLVPSLKILL